jgi:hypothetical protein
VVSRRPGSSRHANLPGQSDPAPDRASRALRAGRRLRSRRVLGSWPGWAARRSRPRHTLFTVSLRLQRHYVTGSTGNSAGQLPFRPSVSGSSSVLPGRVGPEPDPEHQVLATAAGPRRPCQGPAGRQACWRMRPLVPQDPSERQIEWQRGPRTAHRMLAWAAARLRSASSVRLARDRSLVQLSMVRRGLRCAVRCALEDPEAGLSGPARLPPRTGHGVAVEGCCFVMGWLTVWVVAEGS